MSIRRSSICVGGHAGYCVILKIPPEGSELLESYIDKKFDGPVKEAFVEVREGALTIAQVCSCALNRTACFRSIQEWFFAHCILMEAVPKGDVPGKVSHVHHLCEHSLNGIELYWWKTIYSQASLFEMGDRDLDIIL